MSIVCVNGVTPDSLKPLQVRTEAAGAGYVLHHSMVHAVIAEPYTVSLVIRGPAAKDRFVVMDRTTGDAWWQYGATQEGEAERMAKRMTPERLAEVVASLGERAVC